jgi:hypothetical protein
MPGVPLMARQRKVKERIAMGQVLLFRGPVVVRPQLPMHRVLLVSVADELDRDRPVPTHLVPFSDRIGLRYAPRWELTAAGVDPHLSIDAVAPSRPGLRVLAETMSGELIEQDRGGALYCNGELVPGGSVVSFCSLPAECEQQLALGQRVGWLVADRRRDAFVFSVRLSEPLLWIYETPRILGAAGTFGGWMTAARHLIENEIEGERSRDGAPSRYDNGEGRPPHGDNDDDQFADNELVVEGGDGTVRGPS